MMDDEYAGIELDDILEVRKDEKGAYTKFCADILPGAVTRPRNNWLARTAVEGVSGACNTVEEAFALLELENNWNVWREIADWKAANPGKKEMEMGKPETKPKWTVRQDADSQVKHELVEGWRKEGHTRFCELHKLVKHDRESRGGQEFELAFTIKQKTECETARMGRKRKRLEDMVRVDSNEVDLLGELIGNVTQATGV